MSSGTVPMTIPNQNISPRKRFIRLQCVVFVLALALVNDAVIYIQELSDCLLNHSC